MGERMSAHFEMYPDGLLSIKRTLATDQKTVVIHLHPSEMRKLHAILNEWMPEVERQLAAREAEDDERQKEREARRAAKKAAKAEKGAAG